jgi:hypothetical protein
VETDNLLHKKAGAESAPAEGESNSPSEGRKNSDNQKNLVRSRGQK